MLAGTTRAWLCAAVILVPALVCSADSVKVIDTEKSVMTVRVFKSGLLSAFGHDHEISAPISQGEFSERDHRVELTVDARQMRVMDKDVSEKDRAEIQETMLGPKVLDTGKFPEIRFHSTSVERVAEGRYSLLGELTIHEQTHPLKLEVRSENRHYKGAAQLKQRDFGIEPISVGGGAVKVKDEFRVEFDIVAKP